MRFPKRKPMKQWIKEKLDSRSYPGLKWIEKSRGKFEISWKHGSLQDWSWQHDVMVFREWAIYTGKYRPQNISDATKEDPAELAKKWKTNFRCAINALPGVEYVRQESYSRGADARKVYIMKKEKKTKTKRKQKDDFKSEPILAQCSDYETAQRNLADMSSFSRGIDQEDIEQIQKDLELKDLELSRLECPTVGAYEDFFNHGEIFHISSP